MMRNKFMNCFKKTEEEKEKNVKIVVEVDKNFFKKFKKRINEYDDTVSGLTRRLWKQFIAHPALNECHQTLKPQSAKKLQRVTMTLSQALHTKIKATAKEEEASVSYITRRLWGMWFDTHGN